MAFHKRIEFYVRNPGYERSTDAMGVRSIDLEQDAAFLMARQVINGRMQVQKSAQHPFQIENERGEVLGVIPEYVVSWRMFDIEDEWQTVFALPPTGTPSPERKD